MQSLTTSIPLPNLTTPLEELQQAITSQAKFIVKTFDSINDDHPLLEKLSAYFKTAKKSLHHADVTYSKKKECVELFSDFFESFTCLKKIQGKQTEVINPTDVEECSKTLLKNFNTRFFSSSSETFLKTKFKKMLKQAIKSDGFKKNLTLYNTNTTKMIEDCINVITLPKALLDQPAFHYRFVFAGMQIASQSSKETFEETTHNFAKLYAEQRLSQNEKTSYLLIKSNRPNRYLHTERIISVDLFKRSKEEETDKIEIFPLYFCPNSSKQWSRIDTSAPQELHVISFEKIKGRYAQEDDAISSKIIRQFQEQQLTEGKS